MAFGYVFVAARKHGAGCTGELVLHGALVGVELAVGHGGWQHHRLPLAVRQATAHEVERIVGVGEGGFAVLFAELQAHGHAAGGVRLAHV